MSFGKSDRPWLQDMLRHAIADAWATARGFSTDDLGDSQRIALEFALGGILSVLAHTNEDGSEPTPDQVIASGVPQAALVVFERLPAAEISH